MPTSPPINLDSFRGGNAYFGSTNETKQGTLFLSGIIAQGGGKKTHELLPFNSALVGAILIKFVQSMAYVPIIPMMGT